MYYTEEELNNLKNPDGWVVKEIEGNEDDLFKIELHNERGEKYTAVTDFLISNNSKIKTVILFTNWNGGNIFYETVYDFSEKDQLNEDRYYSNQTSLIGFWAIENRLPPDVAKCVWCRCNNIFSNAIGSAILLEYERRYEDETGMDINGNKIGEKDDNNDEKQSELF